jgi:hypothetical protein
VERGFLVFGEALAKAQVHRDLTAMREAHVNLGQLTGRAWEAKLSRNEAENQKDRSGAEAARSSFMETL